MVNLDERGFVTSLDPKEIFVFGSNLAGRHGAGAAKQAHDQFGAQYGVGEGPTGQCYAFPTLDENLEKLPWNHLIYARERFFACAQMRMDLTFILTKVGCGLAGYPEQHIRNLFRWTPYNVQAPPDWL